MSDNISVRKYEEHLVNTDKLAYSLAEAIVRNLVHDRRSITKRINGHVKYYKAIAKMYDTETWVNMDMARYSLVILDKNLVRGDVEGFSFSSANGEEEDRIMGDTFHYTTYASARLVTGLYICGSEASVVVDLFDTIWAHGCYGNEFIIKLTDDMLCGLKAKVEQYLPTMLVSRKFLKEPKNMEREYNQFMNLQAV